MGRLGEQGRPARLRSARGVEDAAEGGEDVAALGPARGGLGERVERDGSERERERARRRAEGGGGLVWGRRPAPPVGGEAGPGAARGPVEERGDPGVGVGQRRQADAGRAGPRCGAQVGPGEVGPGVGRGGPAQERVERAQVGRAPTRVGVGVGRDDLQADGLLDEHFDDVHAPGIAGARPAFHGAGPDRPAPPARA